MTLEIVAVKQNKQPTPATAPQKGKAKQKPSKEKLFTAIARIHGSLVAEGNQLLLVATDDDARFPVRGVCAGWLTIRLLTLEPAARVGLFSFWPSTNGEITLAASHDDSTEWKPQTAGSLHPNQLLVAGHLESMNDLSFTLKVGRNRPTKGLQYTLVQIASPPVPDWHCGQWLELRCQRKGHTWVLPQGDGTTAGKGADDYAGTND